MSTVLYSISHSGMMPQLMVKRSSCALLLDKQHPYSFMGTVVANYLGMRWL